MLSWFSGEKVRTMKGGERERMKVTCAVGCSCQDIAF